jgi:ABC-type glycerol-3-phosphate transport system permease component
MYGYNEATLAMPRKDAPLASKELTLESIEKLDHYHVLGLTEAASSEEIEQALHVERWPWHLVEEGGRAFVTKKRLEAYGVLNDPVTRLAYDRKQGYTKGHLATQIGDETSIWGQTWLILFGVIALIMVVGGPHHPARAIGSAFAPGFEEVIVRKDGACAFPPCPERYEREFRSTSSFWESVLNGFAPWVIPPILMVVIGLALRAPVARAAGYLVAMARFRGCRDGPIRFAMLLAVAAVPIVFLLVFWLLPPDPVKGPPGV